MCADLSFVEESASDEKPWRVSLGSAAVLGLCHARMDTPPTTIYIMLGERCVHNCAFCTQARESEAHVALLSRVSWPAFAQGQVRERLSHALHADSVRRVCLQTVVTPEHLASARHAVAKLAPSGAPICVSIAARSMDEIEQLLEAGAERVAVALDAATPRLGLRAKEGASWERTWGLLERSSARHPGHIGTHLIAGLGESEREMIECLAALDALGVMVGLFAFTPVAGTRMASYPAPPLESYRRIQATRWLLVNHLADPAQFQYDDRGQLRCLGLTRAELRALLGDGEAFRTAGCPGCNRPYYNERPGGEMYNYPRPLAACEIDCELTRLADSLF